MKKEPTGTNRTLLALRQAALRHRNVDEGLACKGTVIESATFKVNGKAFLFLRPGKAMLKLAKSLGEASKLARTKAGCYSVGSGGWITVDLTDPKQVSVPVLGRWIAESYALFAETTGKKPKAAGRTTA